MIERGCPEVSMRLMGPTYGGGPNSIIDREGPRLRLDVQANVAHTNVSFSWKRLAPSMTACCDPAL
jgi:hypothetical protein